VPLDINSVRLGLARPPINLHTRGIDDLVAYALRFEQTVEPEAVIARFVARNHIHAFFFNSPATRVLIRSLSFTSSFQSQGFNVWRLILSDSGVLTATIQLFLLNSKHTVRRHHGMRRAAGSRPGLPSEYQSIS
jgi:hypothetical protein